MEDSLAPVSWGVIGTADIAIEKVIPAMLQSELSRVDAIASRSSERASEVAAELGIPRAYESYEGLLADPGIEAVYIPLPNHLHREWALAAAEAGKHVLCEKPLSTSTDDVNAIVEGCAEAGVKVMEAFMYRLHPMWVEVRRMVESGLIGEPRAIQTFFSYHNVDPDNIRNIPEFGGGALFDIGCYAVNVARMIFASEPTDIKAVIRRDARFGTDVLTSAVLDFDGRQSTFTCSTQLEDDQRVTIVGPEGRLVVEIPFNIPPDRTTRILHFTGGEPPVAPGEQVHEIPAADQYAVQADAFSRAIRLDTEVPTPTDDALGNIAVIERILAAAAG